MKENSTSFPVLTTARLVLRQLSNADDFAIFTLRSDDRVNEYIDRPKQTSMDEARAFILKINEGIKQNRWIYWAICLKDAPDLIGTICLWNFSEDKITGELGYELRQVFQEKGFMNEAIKAVITYGIKNLRLKKIDAYTHKENLPSAQLLLKNDFIPDHNRKDELNINNIIYSLTVD